MAARSRPSLAFVVVTIGCALSLCARESCAATVSVFTPIDAAISSNASYVRLNGTLTWPFGALLQGDLLPTRAVDLGSRRLVVDGGGLRVVCAKDTTTNVLPIAMDIKSGTVIIRNLTVSSCLVSSGLANDYGLLFRLSGKTASLSLEDVSFQKFSYTRIVESLATRGWLNLTRVLLDSVNFNRDVVVPKGGVWTGRDDCVAHITAQGLLTITDSTIVASSVGGKRVLRAGAVCAVGSAKVAVRGLTVRLWYVPFTSGGIIYAADNAAVAVSALDTDGVSVLVNYFGAVFAEGSAKVTVARSWLSGSTDLFEGSAFPKEDVGSGADNGGAVFARDSAHVVVSDSRIETWRAAHGAGVYAEGTSLVEFHNVTVVGMSADYSGALAHVADDASFKLENSVIANSHFPFYDDLMAYDDYNNPTGVVWAEGSASVTVRDTSFTNSYLWSGGIVATVDSAVVTVSNCTVTNMRALLYGGAFRTADDAILTVSDVTVTNTTAAGGGFLYASGGKVVLSNVVVTNSSADKHGGCFLLSGTANVTLIDGAYTHCSANASPRERLGEGGFARMDDASTFTALGTVVVSAPSASRGPGVFFVLSDRTAAPLLAGLSFRDGLFVPKRVTESLNGWAGGGALTTRAQHLVPIARVPSAGATASSSRAPTGAFTAIATAQASIASPIAQAIPSSAGPAVGSASTAMAAAQALVSGAAPAPIMRVHVTPGSTTSPFDIELQDGFGNPVTLDPLKPLAIRLRTNDSAVELKGNDDRSFGVRSKVTVNALTVYGRPGTYRVYATSANPFVYGSRDDSDDAEWGRKLVDSFSLELVVEPCSAGHNLTNSSGRWDCVQLPVAAQLLASPAGSSSRAVAIAVPVSLVAGAVLCFAIFGLVRWRIAAIRLAQSQATHRDFMEKHVANNAGLISIELPRESVDVLERLGSGEFGEVFKARVMVDGRPRLCAAKTAREGLSYDDRVAFVSEAEIMQNLNSPRIVGLCGVVLQSEPVLLLLEFLPYGSLRQFVLDVPITRRTHPSTVEILDTFATHIAEAGAYLESVNVVHRDLAARNCLVGQDSFGSMVVKVGDFGMSKDLGQKDYFRAQKEKSPIRWMAPERYCVRL
eukprot:Opistho-1_new@1520